MADWLRGESLFDPSPEDIARYGVQRHIPLDEPVHWIGRPTALSYFMCKGNMTLITLIVVTLIGMRNPYGNTRNIYFVFLFTAFCITIFLDNYLLSKNTYYFISEDHIGLIRSKRFLTILFWRWKGSGRNFIYPIILSDYGYAISYGNLNIGTITFSGLIHYSSGCYKEEDLYRPEEIKVIKEIDTYYIYQNKSIMSMMLNWFDFQDYDAMNKFMGISNVDQVIVILKQTVLAFWRNKDRQIE